MISWLCDYKWGLRGCFRHINHFTFLSSRPNRSINNGFDRYQTFYCNSTCNAMMITILLDDWEGGVLSIQWWESHWKMGRTNKKCFENHQFRVKPSYFPSNIKSPIFRPCSVLWNGRCVKDRKPRLFPKYLGKTNTNTPSNCIRRCKEADNGYLFAGVQYGSECFCGNVPPPGSPSDLCPLDVEVI